MASLKPKNNNNSESNVDWEKINESLPDGDVLEARLAYVVDLGTQHRGKMVAHNNKDGMQDYCYAADEEEAIELCTQAKDIIGDYIFDKENLDDVEEVDVDKKNLKEVQEYVEDAEVGDEVILLPFRIVELKDAQEVAYIADCVDHYVEYVEGEEEKQYRVYFNNRDFMTGKLSGFALTVVPPKKKGGDWTYSPVSMHSKLAKATHTDLVKADNDISEMLNKPFGIQVTKNDKGYPKFTPSPIQKKYLKDIAELDCKPECITFEDATLEQLQELKPNRLLVDKIKSALDYEGSEMEKALEAYESLKKKKDEDEEEESPPKKRKPKTTKVVKEEVEEESDNEEEEEKAKPARRGRKPKVEREDPEPEESDEPDEEEDDDDIPW